MTNQRSAELRVGVVSFLAIILLIAGILWGRGFNVSANQNIIQMHFPSSSGIEATAPVTINGVKRGAVTSVKNVENGVVISVMLDNIADLKKDAKAKIMMLEITGGKKIEITPGSANEAFDTKQMLPGGTDPDIAELISLVGEIGSDAKVLIRRVDTIAASATSLLADGSVVKNVRQTVDNLNSTMISVSELVEKNKKSLQITIDNINTITADLRQAVKVNSPKVESLLGKLDSTVTSANKLIGNVDGTLKNADSLVSQVNGLLSDVKNGKGLVSKLLYDQKFSAQLDSSLTLLRDFVEKVHEHGVNVNVRLGTRP